MKHIPVNVRRILRLSPAVLVALPLAGQAADAPRTLDKVVVSTDADDGAGYLAEVATTASKVPKARREIPASISVLSRAQIEEQNLVTLWDALQQITGVQAISNDNTQAQYYARGNSLDLRHEGMPSALQLSGYQQFDLAMYERVEVQRGPGGLFQGSGSYGGVVNLVRKRAKAGRDLDVFVSAGSWNNLRAELDGSTTLNAAGSLRARAVLSLIDREYVFQGIENRKRFGYGTIEYDLAPSTQASAYVGWQDDRGPGFSGLPTYTNGQYLNVPRSFNPYPAWNQDNWGTLEKGVELTHRFGNDWTLTVRGARRDQDLFFKDSYPTTGVTPGTNVIANYARREFEYDYTLNGLDAYLAGGFEAFGRRHDFVLGYNDSRFLSTGRGANPNQTPALNYPNVPLASLPAVPEPTVVYRTGSQSETRQSGIYGQLSLRVAEPLTVVAGGRLTDYASRSRTMVPAPAPTDWARGAVENSQLTPFAGVVWDFAAQWSAYGSYSDVFVPQTQRRVDGSLLDPRIGRQYELGVKADLAGQALHATAAVFNIRDRNRAYADPANTGFWIQIGEVESEGVEFEMVGRPAPALELSAGYTYLRTEYVVNATLAGQPISYWYPKHSLKAWGTYRFSEGPLGGLRLGGGFNAYSRMASGTSTATVAARAQGGYAVASLQGAYAFSQRLEATLTVNNLFDRKYYTRMGGTNTYNTFGEPLNATLSVRLSLD